MKSLRNNTTPKTQVADDGDTSLRTDANQIGQDIRKFGRHAKEAATESFTDATATVREFLGQKPLRSVLIAFGAGALVSLLFRLRR